MTKSLRRRPPSISAHAPVSPPSQVRRPPSTPLTPTLSSPATSRAGVVKRSRVRASTFAIKPARRRQTRRQLRIDLESPSVSPSQTLSPSRKSRRSAARRQDDDSDYQSVDKLINDVRSFMRSTRPSISIAEDDHDDIRSLRTALDRADAQFLLDSGHNPASDTSSSSTTNAAREELGESEPNASHKNSQFGAAATSSTLHRSPSASTKKTNKTPQSQRLARLRARLEKSRLTPQPKNSKLDYVDESDDEACLSISRGDIEALKKDDPEFYKFLEENDAALLDIDDLTFDEGTVNTIEEAENSEPKVSNCVGSDEDGNVENIEPLCPSVDNCQNGTLDATNSEAVNISERNRTSETPRVKRRNSGLNDSPATSFVAAAGSEGLLQPVPIIELDQKNSEEEPCAECGVDGNGETNGTNTEDSEDSKVKTVCRETNINDKDNQISDNRKHTRDNVGFEKDAAEASTANAAHAFTEDKKADSTDNDIIPSSETSVQPVSGENDIPISKYGNCHTPVEDDATGYSGSEEDDSELDEAKAAVEAGLSTSGNNAELIRTSVDVEGAKENTDLETVETSRVIDLTNNTNITINVERSDGDGGSNNVNKVEVESDLSNANSNSSPVDSGREFDDEASPRSTSPLADNDNSIGTNENFIVIDLQYLRNLKELLNSKRAGVKVCRDLLRILQCGRDILPKSISSGGKRTKNKGDRKASGNESFPDGDESDIDDDYTDDGNIIAGKVKFTSGKAYQQAMNLAIIALQDALDRLLDKPAEKKPTDTYLLSWVPSESERWPNLQHIFQSYVFNMLRLVDVVSDALTLRFLLKRLERMAPYTHENEMLLKKILRSVLRIWSSDTQYVSQDTRLQAYLLTSKLAHVPGNTETVLRCCFNTFSSTIAPVCNPKTLPLIRFSVACLVELFGIDMGVSYTVVFSYLREMAVILRSVLISKGDPEDVEKVHNWRYMNELRLWSRVLGKYGVADELRPLIYPYVQVGLGVMRLHWTPRSLPLRLHIASFLTDVVQETGVYIPIAPNLVLLLRCSELKKHPRHSDGKDLEWRSLLRVSDDAVKTKAFLSGLVDGVAFELCRFFAIIAKHVSFPELSFVAETALRKVAKDMAVPEWKAKLLMVASKLKATADVIAKARAKADLAPRGAISDEGMLACVPNMDRSTKLPIERLFEVERERMQKQDRLRDEVGSRKRPSSEKTEDDSEGETPAATADGTPSAKKKARVSLTRKTEFRERPSLQVPEVVADDEQDQVAKLNLDSDSSGSE